MRKIIRQQPEIGRHREHEQRDGKQQTDDQEMLLLGHLFLARQALGVFAGHIFLIFETQLAQQFGQVSHIQFGGHVLHPQQPGGLVDLQLIDARQLFDPLFDQQGIAVIAQIFDQITGFAQGHVIPGPPHPVHQHRQGQVQVQGHRGLLRGKIDRSRLDAFFFAQAALDGRRAVGAGHPQDW